MRGRRGALILPIMTTNTITPAVATDWTATTSFRFRFAEHAQYPGIHSKFNFAFSYDITDPDDLFADAELRTTLHPSAIALVRTKIVDSIKSQATSTADKTTILPMFNNLLLSTQASTGLLYQIRTVANFGDSLDHVLVSKKTFMIFIDPSRLRFATNPPDVRNFDQM